MFTHDQIWNGLDNLATAKGFSASGLAKQAGLDPTSFNKSKRVSPDGKPRWPSTESLSKVLNVTKTTMSEFIALIDQDGSGALPVSGVLNTKDVARRTAEILIKTKSVLFNAKKPFILKSGKASPVYIDGRRLISFVKDRTTLMNFAAARLSHEVGDENFDMIAGGETAGIPYGAFIADRLKKPMIYVRKKPKGYGRMAQIEGVLPKGARTVLVEDLQTDGGSKHIFIDALRMAEAQIEHVFVIFHYGIFPESEQNMDKVGVKLHALATWHDVLAVAKDNQYFDPETLSAVESFLKAPQDWTP